jgi:hypothetical protein
MNWLKRITRGKASNGVGNEIEQRPHPYRIKTVDDLWNHIAYVRGYAPNYFKKEDFLLPEEQMTLDLAFKFLDDGIDVAYPEDGFAEKRSELRVALSRALSAYRAGDEIAGATILQVDFEDKIFKP